MRAFNGDWTRAARRALALRPEDKLPAAGRAPIPFIGGTSLYVRPLALSRFSGSRRMSARVYVRCLCGKEVPAGRMAQHLGWFAGAAGEAHRELLTVTFEDLTGREHESLANCPTCGEALRMRYPGGDPENGPAARRCPKDHRTADPCDFCPRSFHEALLPARDGSLHDSWGNEA